MKQDLPSLLPEALRTSASRVSLVDRQMLFHQGEPVEYIYYVLRGELLAVRYLPDGTEAVMQRARAGEFFAQSAIAVSHYACDARATSATDVARLPVRRLKESLTSDGTFALAFAAQLASDLRRQCTRVERLRIKRARDRILHFLVCEGTLPERGLRVVDLSQEIGLDASTVSRTITELRATGEVVGQGRQIRLASRIASPRIDTG